MLLPGVGDLLVLVLLGGWVAADGTGLGQLMVSRPFVAATLAGAVVGHPLAGAALGVILEAFHLCVLPVGAARYPEPGPAAVVGAALFALSDRTAATLLTIVVFALLWEWVSGESVRLMRHLNGQLAVADARPGDPVRLLERRHLLAVGVDFGRGVLLTLLGLPLLAGLLQLTTPLSRWDAEFPRAALAAAVAGLLAGAYRLFGGRARLFVAGVAAGLFLILVRS